MSDDVLSIIPTDPHWQPDRAAADCVAAIVADLTFGDDDVGVDVTWHDTLTVVDCGENLERIGCPHCAASIGLAWWADLLEGHCEDGFATLAVQVPCCAAESSLDALQYGWPCGFARFEIAIWNPERAWFTGEELTTLAGVLGHPVRQVRAHLCRSANVALSTLVCPGCEDHGMVLCDYFSAGDDDAAVRVLDRPGGPDTSAFEVVSLKGVDPVVVMARLEAILTGCTYDEACRRPRSGQLLSSPDDEGAFIVTVSDTLQEALGSATHDFLVEASGPWSETGELRQYAITSEAALEVLIHLSGLASRARSSGLRLFCWWAL
ncbi:hypothetical protein [Streptomyces sp. NPDC048496]|uniref:hypothetical protein n=1 Tax=Streptomyces sp. NPDC048496 TaxID=3365558 RepID=UPI003712D5EB